jgi:hypothetical protein
VTKTNFIFHIDKSSKMAHFGFKCNKEDYLSLFTLINLARRPRDRIGVQFVPQDLPQLVAWTSRG